MLRCEKTNYLAFLNSRGSRTVWSILAVLEYQCEPVQPQSTSSDISLSLLVPQVRPAITTNIINSEYIVHVLPVMPCATNMTVEIPVVIGNAAVLQQPHCF